MPTNLTAALACDVKGRKMRICLNGITQGDIFGRSLSANVRFPFDSDQIAALRGTAALGHVWTAPAVQEESDFSAKRVQPCIRPVVAWKITPRRDAAAVAAGPDVIR